jgi:hypothetical protein
MAPRSRVSLTDTHRSMRGIWDNDLERTTWALQHDRLPHTKRLANSRSPAPDQFTSTTHRPETAAIAGFGLVNAHQHNREQREKLGGRATRNGFCGRVTLTSTKRRSPPTLAFRATKSPDREGSGLRVWWARRDLNPGPKDYAYHYGFRRLRRVCGLDYTFPLQAGRLVSTPFPLLPGAWLGIGMS